MLDPGIVAPDFKAPDQEGRVKSLSDLKGQWVVLYFYPKDDTPGCTMEACGIRDNYEKLKDLAAVWGVSSDTVVSHKAFVEKYKLPFTLLSDPDKKIIGAYGAGGLVTKRITYIINPQGVIAKIYPRVNAAQHVGDLLSDLQYKDKLVVPEKSL